MKGIGSGAPSTPLPRITDREFKAIGALVLREAGIALLPHKSALVVARLTGRLRELGLPTFGEYHKRALDDETELARLLDRITTHETRFFRETRHFTVLENVVYPGWKTRKGGARHLRFLSAGCSTGEEPFSLAMSAGHHLPRDEGWNVEVVGADISHATLAQARAATWSIDKAEHIPEAYRKAFMLKGVKQHEHLMRASRELRSMVHFQFANLNGDAFSRLGAFDVIFCCNVLMYFDSAARRHSVRRLLERLKPNGYLFLGHADSLAGFEESVRGLAPNAYTLSSSGDNR
jgi:chemotaxis protein methyltransferase CheR